MSVATVVPLPDSRYRLDLKHQRLALGEIRPRTLFVCCAESLPRGALAWERKMPSGLFLRTPGATVDGLGVREAIRFALEDLGPEEVVVVAHSLCEHLGGDAPPERRGASFYERMQARMAHGQRKLAAARNHVRIAVRQLEADPSLPIARASGLIHLIESGTLLAYDTARDRFEPCL